MKVNWRCVLLTLAFSLPALAETDEILTATQLVELVNWGLHPCRDNPYGPNEWAAFVKDKARDTIDSNCNPDDFIMATRVVRDPERYKPESYRSLFSDKCYSAVDALPWETRATLFFESFSSDDVSEMIFWMWRLSPVDDELKKPNGHNNSIRVTNAVHDAVCQLLHRDLSSDSLKELARKSARLTIDSACLAEFLYAEAGLLPTINADFLIVPFWRALSTTLTESCNQDDLATIAKQLTRSIRLLRLSWIDLSPRRDSFSPSCSAAVFEALSFLDQALLPVC